MFYVKQFSKGEDMELDNITLFEAKKLYGNLVEGYFKNGDLWNGGRRFDVGIEFFEAIKQGNNLKDGADYETDEVPKRFALCRINRYTEGLKMV